MNIYFIIIFSAIILDYLLSMIVNKLNLNSLNPELPSEFSDVYDQDKYIKSQEYTRTNTRFTFITSTFSTALVLCVIIFGIN